MFKSKIEDLGLLQQMNNKSMRGVRQTLLEQFPLIEDVMEDIINKKSNMQLVKLKNEYKTNLILVDDEILFFEQFKENLVCPVLQILLKYPHIMNKMVVDKGGISRVITGANVMCPGLTSQGGYVTPGLTEGTIVAIYGEGKTHPFAIGKMLMSSQQIVEQNKGIAIEMLHFLKDGLWNYKSQNNK